MEWIWWAPLWASVAHITEEFVYPGGFAEWDRAYRSQIRSSITPLFHLIVNAALLFAGLNVGLAGSGGVQIAGSRIRSSIPDSYAVVFWLGLAALLFSNAIFHLVGTIRTRRRSPGLITSLALYLPLFCYGSWHFLSNSTVSPKAAIGAISLGGLYPLWSAIAHRYRANLYAKNARQ